MDPQLVSATHFACPAVLAFGNWEAALTSHSFCAGNLIARERPNMWHSCHHFSSVGTWLISPINHKIFFFFFFFSAEPRNLNVAFQEGITEFIEGDGGHLISSNACCTSSFTLPHPLCDAGAETLPTRGSQREAASLEEKEGTRSFLLLL